jgi:hypothetical protein
VVTFSFSDQKDGRPRRVVFEERLDAAAGTSRLVATHVDGDFSDEEMERARADAFARWLHPNEPPDDWFK